jgi:hypothetical protein
MCWHYLFEAGIFMSTDNTGGSIRFHKVQFYKMRGLGYEEESEYLNERTYDIFRNKRLYMSKISELNDVHEATPYCESGALLGWLEKLMESYRICSLTEVDNSPLMWSHYANNCKGICIKVTLDLDEIFFNNDSFRFLHCVKYISDKSSFRRYITIKECMRVAKGLGGDRAFARFLQKVFCYKSVDWKYEKEHRVVGVYKDSGPAFLPVDSIDEIHFGPAMTLSSCFKLLQVIDECGAYTENLPDIFMTHKQFGKFAFSKIGLDIDSLRNLAEKNISKERHSLPISEILFKYLMSPSDSKTTDQDGFSFKVYNPPQGWVELSSLGSEEAP